VTTKLSLHLNQSELVTPGAMDDHLLTSRIPFMVLVVFNRSNFTVAGCRF
jgi:hypothetical protein